MKITESQIRKTIRRTLKEYASVNSLGKLAIDMQDVTASIEQGGGAANFARMNQIPPDYIDALIRNCEDLLDALRQ